MRVYIFSRNTIEKLLQTDFPKNVAVISFYDVPSALRFRTEPHSPVDYSKHTSRVFQVAMYDMFELSDAYFAEADELARFIYSANAEGLDIICQCEYGKSRSSACAAAILEHFYQEGGSILADSTYNPNPAIYEKLLASLEKHKRELTL